MSMWVRGKLSEPGWPFLYLCVLGWERSPCHFHDILLAKGSHSKISLLAAWV